MKFGAISRQTWFKPVELESLGIEHDLHSLQKKIHKSYITLRLNERIKDLNMFRFPLLFLEGLEKTSHQNTDSLLVFTIKTSLNLTLHSVQLREILQQHVSAKNVATI